DRQALQALDPGVAVITGAWRLAHLDEPGPDLLRPGLDRDRPGRDDARLGDPVAQRHRARDLLGRGTPVPVPGADEPDVDRPGPDEGDGDLERSRNFQRGTAFRPELPASAPASAQRLSARRLMPRSMRDSIR